MRTIIYTLIILLFMSCSNKPKKYKDLIDTDYTHESEKVNGETIYYMTAISDNEPQKFINLDKTDNDFLIKCREFFDSIIKTNCPNKSQKDYTPETLDNLIDLYNAKKLDCSQNAFVNSVGVAMGDYLVEKLGMKWIIVEDEYGRDFGTTIGEIKLTNFPLNSVLKAIEQKREGSLQTLYLLTLKNKTDLIKK